MLELTAAIILIIGLIGMAVVIFRKIPVLVELPPQEIEKPGALGKLKDKIRNNGTLESFSGEILLQKLLSKVRVLTLKTDEKTDSWLTKLRQRSLEKRKKFSADYWKKLKRKE